MPNSSRKTTPTPMPNQEILNIDGAAAFLGVSVKTFSKVLREGDVPGRKVGREWKFSRQALIDWVSSSRSRDFLDGADDADDSSNSTSKSSSRRSGNDGFSVDQL
ncbi:MAG: hypothetical protein DHS20C15_09620 [Planctomycetota bacterium]|nr:MAG: hypothetical protein DHS20C15_09620 [Planctomycetota bacterium]